MSQQQQWGAQPPNAAYGQQQPAYMPGNSQPYAQQYNPAPNVEQGYGAAEKAPTAGGRFKSEKRVRDPVFLILFWLQFIGFCVVSGLALSYWVRESGLNGGLGSNSTGNSVTLNSSTAYLLLLVAAAGLVLSTLYFILTRAFTHAIMHITLLLTIALNIGICAYYWVTKYWSGAIIFTIIAILSILSYWGYRSRIPLASLLLQVVMDVSKAHKSVYLVAFTTLLIQAGLSVWYTFSVIATYIRWTPGSPSCSNGSSCSSGTVAGLIFFLTFSYIWTSMTINNVSLATLAGGPYGSWYYFGPRDAGLMPKHPTTQSFFRASTTSLGSIAFGSLIVTILEIIRLILNSLRNQSIEDGDPITAILTCCAQWLVGIIEGMVQYFNRYAYIEIALYGKPYISAAKDTWRMFKDRGIDALVNDSLVSMTLTWGAYLVGVLCSLFAYLYLRFTDPSYNADGQYTAPVLLFAFLIGAQLHLTLASAIEAGVSTIFVGLGEDPYVLAARAPALFDMIVQRYPQVVQGVPRVR